jgi:hypothetical protein
MELLSAKDYSGILKLWKNVKSNTYCDPTCPEWIDKPYYHAIIRSCVIQIFYAHAQLGCKGNFEEHVPNAIGALDRLRRDRALLETPSQDYAMSGEAVLIQDQKLFDVLMYAEKWLRMYGAQFSEALGVDNRAASAIETAVAQRALQLAHIIDEFDSTND